MEITDVRVRSLSDTSDRLKAVCTVTFDGSFVVRDVKVVDGTNGLFVAMPSRKVTISCTSCRHKNAVRAKFCNDCGARLPEHQMPPGDVDGRGKLHRDIAHPITSEFRAIVQGKIIEAYHAAADAYEEPVVEEFEESAPAEEAVVEKESTVDAEAETDLKPSSSGGTDEYNAMIAGLKGGKAGADRKTERGGQGGRSERPRGRRERGRGRERVTEDRQPEERVEKKVEEKVVEQVVAVKEPDSDDAFSAGLDMHPPREAPAPAAPDRVSVKEAAAEPVVSEDSCDDSAPFGMGLL